jgi:hypothetical protein
MVASRRLPFLMIKKGASSAVVSHSSQKTATKAGCPIQAVFWLEWDTTHSLPVERTAGPSTALRSGRDDKSV